LYPKFQRYFRTSPSSERASLTYNAQSNYITFWQQLFKPQTLNHVTL